MQLIRTVERIGLVLGLIVGYFGLAGLLENFVQGINGPTGWVASGAVVLLLIALGTFCVFREFQLARRGRYANIGGALHGIQHTIRDLNTFLDTNLSDPNKLTSRETQLVRAKVRERLVHVLDNVRSVFEIVTSASCRACIKTFEVGDDGELYVVTLTRDENSNTLCRELDRRRAESRNDPLSENPYFKTIVLDHNPVEPAILVNDLTKADGFETTSIKAYAPGSERVLSSGRRTVGQKWPLPYRSALSYAIRQPESEELVEQGKGAIGIISVDCLSRNVFSDRWDIPLISSVADSLFHVLFKYIDLQELHDQLLVTEEKK